MYFAPIYDYFKVSKSAYQQVSKTYLRLIDSCITQLKDQGPSRTCNESKEEEEEEEEEACRWRAGRINNFIC